MTSELSEYTERTLAIGDASFAWCSDRSSVSVTGKTGSPKTQNETGSPISSLLDKLKFVTRSLCEVQSHGTIRIRRGSTLTYGNRQGQTR